MSEPVPGSLCAGPVHSNRSISVLRGYISTRGFKGTSSVGFTVAPFVAADSRACSAASEAPQDNAASATA